MSTAENVGPKELFENSPVQMAEVIAHLLQGRGVAEIAELTGVPKGRITRWYRESERFKEMLDEISTEAVDRIRSEVVRESADRLVELVPSAIDALAGGLEAEKASERTAAAAHILRFAGLGAKKGPEKVGPSPEDLIRGPREPAAGD